MQNLNFSRANEDTKQRQRGLLEILVGNLRIFGIYIL